VSQEGITNEEQILIFAWKSAFVNYEIALSFITLVKILFWVDFKDVITHLEPYWFYFGGHFFAWFLYVAESLIRFTVKIWESRGPFHSNFLEDIWWDRKL